MERGSLPSILRAISLDSFPHFDDEGRESLVGNVFAGVDGSEDFSYCLFDFRFDFPPATVQQPPTEGQELAVVFEVVAACALVDSFVFFVFEVD